MTNADSGSPARSPKVDFVGPDDLARARGGAAYVRALLESGARFYVDNADVPVRAVEVDGRLYPVVAAGGTSDVCSPSAHYVWYAVEEVGRRHPRVPRSTLRVSALPFAEVVRAAGIDRVVYANNWLFTTNPSPRLSSEQVAALTAALVAEYPRHAIVFRSINPEVDRGSFDALRANGFRLVRSRRVYLFDGSARAPLKRDLKADLELLRRTPYALIADAQALAGHAARLADLYRDLYLVKYSRLNPAFNARFVGLTLETGVCTYRALARDDRIDAFISFFVEDGTMTGALVGYDRAVAQEVGLYRMAFTLMLAEAMEGGLQVNLSAGAGEFKLHRGAVPVEEFDAVYDRHLSARRRAGWAALASVARSAARHSR